LAVWAEWQRKKEDKPSSSLVEGDKNFIFFIQSSRRSKNVDLIGFKGLTREFSLKRKAQYS
jgi:hypothetical protein